MEDLKEHFKADFLLARTLMACLRFDQLRDVVKNEHIPYDAILATLCYYITTEKNIVQRETVSILAQPKSINTQLRAVSLTIYYGFYNL